MKKDTRDGSGLIVGVDFKFFDKGRRIHVYLIRRPVSFTRWDEKADLRRGVSVGSPRQHLSGSAGPWRRSTMKEDTRGVSGLIVGVDLGDRFSRLGNLGRFFSGIAPAVVGYPRMKNPCARGRRGGGEGFRYRDLSGA